MFLAVLALVLLHLLLVMPFIDSRRAESETSQALDRLEAVENGLNELRSALQAVFAETGTVMTPALDRLSENLDLDLDRLDATRRRIVSQALAEAADGDAAGAEAATAGDTTSLPTDPRAPPLQLDNPDWIADLRDARSRDELLAALTPIVDQLITRPRYFDIGSAWQNEALPGLVARLDAAAGIVPRLRGRFPEAQDQWEALVGALNEFNRTAQEVRFRPPELPFWWTVPTLDGELALGLPSAVRAEIRQPRQLVELQNAAARAVERYEEVGSRLTRAREALGQTPADRVAGLRLANAALLFPWLIGAILGGAVLRRSQRLRELGLVTQLAIEHGGPQALERWLWAQVQWSSAVSSFNAAWRRCVVQTLAGYFLIMSWIGGAAVQLRQLPGIDRQRLMASTIAGASIVLLAIVHRLWITRRAIEPAARHEAADARVGARPEAVAETAFAALAADGRTAGGERQARGSNGDDLDPSLTAAPDAELIEVQPLRR